MPRVLTVTQNEGESEEQFAARLATEMQSFFGAGSGEEVAKEEGPAETSTEPTDVSAEEAAPPEEVAPPG